MERVQRDRLETECNGERQRAMERGDGETTQAIEKARVSLKFQFCASLEQEATVSVTVLTEGEEGAWTAEALIR